MLWSVRRSFFDVFSTSPTKLFEELCEYPPMRDERTRRRFLTALGAGGVFSGIPIGSAVSNPIRLQDDEDTVDDPHVMRVVAGPDGAWRFEPAEVTIGLGEAVDWYFDSPGHNVTSHPDASDKNRNPRTRIRSPPTKATITSP